MEVTVFYVYQTVVARCLNGGGFWPDYSMLVFDGDNSTFVSNSECESCYMLDVRGERVVDLISLDLSSPVAEIDVGVAKVFEDKEANFVWQCLQSEASGGSSLWCGLWGCYRFSLVCSRY
jgi:hypothetical protein